MAEKIHMRMDQITAARSVEELVQGNIGRCYLLKGNRKDEYAVELVHPYRVVFRKSGNVSEAVCIVEITAYH